MPQPVRYRSDDEDSARWWGFPFRPGDIVISSRSKSGTTWVQMICALLVFQRTDLPAPLGRLSPWLDWIIEPLDEVVGRLEAQRHRRFIKTHTPLDGLPADGRVTSIVVARHPLDAAVSLYHHGHNLDREMMHRLSGRPGTPDGSGPPPPDLLPWLREWIRWDGPPDQRLDSLRGVLHHLSDAWARRHEPNVVLLHYADLTEDLEGEMPRLAGRLGITVPEDRWSGLVRAATFPEMRARAPELAPGPVLLDPAAFFRRGSSGEGSRSLTLEDLDEYEARIDRLAPPGLSAWLHR